LLDSLNKPVINPTALLRWNMHKSYLREISEQDVNIIPTVFVEDAQHSLLDVLNQQEWAEAIIKPMVGGSGDHIQRVHVDDCTKHEQSFGWLVDSFGMLVQPYLPEIEKDGEYSLVFFDGTYSHAMHKQPADGEFLVHEERGGSLKPCQPNERMIETASRSIASVTQITGIQPTYTRVDGVLVKDEFLLMECECVEPELYFKHGSGAAETLVRCILKALS
ncbi:MAG: glutathione synthetase, partial [Chloroflexota bacterium]